MKKTIWKYALEPRATLKMPQGAKVLTVQMQNGEPQLWALAAPDAPQMERRFVTYGTGHDMPENPGEYVGTFQMHGGTLVFHVFEEPSAGDELRAGGNLDQHE